MQSKAKQALWWKGENPATPKMPLMLGPSPQSKRKYPRVPLPARFSLSNSSSLTLSRTSNVSINGLLPEAFAIACRSTFFSNFPGPQSKPRSSDRYANNQLEVKTFPRLALLMRAGSGPHPPMQSNVRRKHLGTCVHFGSLDRKECYPRETQATDYLLRSACPPGHTVAIERKIRSSGFVFSS